LNLSDLPFNACDFTNFHIRFIKPVLSLTEFASYRIPICYPVRSSALCI
jgi:hypothetical protein